MKQESDRRSSTASKALHVATDFFDRVMRHGVFSDQRHRLIPLLLLTVGAACRPASALETKGERNAMNESPIEIGARKQVFLDGFFMAASEGVRLTLHTPYRDGRVLIAPDRAWEEKIGVYSSVLKEDGKVRVWYDARRGPKDREVRVAYAESEDGLHFRKPELGLHEVDGSTANNIVLPESRIAGAAVWKDPHAAPAHRYKTQTKVYPSGRLAMHSSPDGIHWQSYGLLKLGDIDTQNIVFWDDPTQRYVLYTREWIELKRPAEPGFPDWGDAYRYRAVRRLESDDLKHWDRQQIVLTPDEIDQAARTMPTPRPPVDFYGAAVIPYADRAYLMFVQAYWQWWDWEAAGLGPATFDVQLAVSRDGQQFQRIGDRRPFMSLGPEGRFDSRYVWAMPNPIQMDDELWIYYVGHNVAHPPGGAVDPTADQALFGIGRAVLRLDGFVSVEGGYAGGWFITPPLLFEGNRLELNADAAGGGSVAVEVLDIEGRSLAGFTREAAVPLVRNSVRQRVVWANEPDLGALAGRPVRLRFYLQNAHLYAFQFLHETATAPREQGVPQTMTAKETKPSSAPVAGNPQRLELLPPGPGNPRNSEGDFIQLRDGRLMFVYTHFSGGRGDHAAAHLAARFSADGGATWTEEDRLVLPNEGGMNVMSVSLVRLPDDRIALFYVRKNSIEDCRPLMRLSADEAETWSEPIEIIPDEEVGYYVLNNDRVVQLDSGRLVVPLARHHGVGWKEWTKYGRIACHLSDDHGATWRRSETVLTGESADGARVMLQEPGVVELRDGRLMLFCRTDTGSQYVSYSEDGGETWSPAQPSNIVSPRSPASIERIPGTGDLLLVWNDHREIPDELIGRRTPLTAAVSRDDGRTWSEPRTLYDDPDGWYCYTAIEFVEDQVVLAHCAGKNDDRNRLAMTNITRFPITWLSPASRFEVVLNHDGFGLLAELAATDMTEEDAVRLLVTPLVEAGFTAIDWCILTTGQHNCRTRHGRGFAGEGVGREVDRLVGEVVTHYNNQPRDLLDIVVASGQAAGLRVFGNIRLNHGALNTERLLSCPGRDFGEKKDFRDPAFHAYLIELVEDLLAKGVDGISLDFERKAPFFPDEASVDERRQACLDFLRRVRAVCSQPIVARVSHERRKGERQGQDPEAWIAEGLVDAVVPATHNHEPDKLDWFPETMVAAAAAAPRPCVVWPQIWPTPEPWNGGEHSRHPPADIRRRVENLRARGAGGVYFFNFTPAEVRAVFAEGKE